VLTSALKFCMRDSACFHDSSFVSDCAVIASRTACTGTEHSYLSGYTQSLFSIESPIIHAQHHCLKLFPAESYACLFVFKLRAVFLFTFQYV